LRFIKISDMHTGVILEFLNMGGGEIMLILGVVLLLFGGKKLPELARGLGKGIRDFKDASEGVKREIHRNINAMDIDDDLKAENEKYEQQHPPVNTPTLEEQMYPTAAASINLTKSSDTEEVEIPASESPSEVAAEAPLSATETTEAPASSVASASETAVEKTSSDADESDLAKARPAPAPLGTPIAAYSATAAAAKANAAPAVETVTPETASAATEVSGSETVETAKAQNAPATSAPATAKTNEAPAAPKAAATETAASSAPAVETITPDTDKTVPSETDKK
jgi:sec-independent protein translocase protein TatA